MAFSLLAPKYVIILIASMVIFLWIVWSGRVSDLHSSLISNTKPQEKESDLIINQQAIDPNNLCTPESFNEGQWEYSQVLEPQNATENDVAAVSKYTCSAGFHHKCYTRGGQELVRSAKMVNFKWRPKCQLLNFQPGLLASQIAANPILFVGDSITELQYESLKCLLGEYGDPTEFELDTKKYSKIFEIQNKVAARFVRSDYFLRLDTWKIQDKGEEPGPTLGKGFNQPWANLLPRFRYLILNTAAHWHKSTLFGENESLDEMMAAYEKAINAALDTVQQHKHLTTYVRSSPYGHGNCSLYTEPLQKPNPPNGTVPWEYEWHLFPKMNELWKKAIKVRNDPKIKYLDVSRLTELRGDVHSHPNTDCLHTCIPGPVDDWNKLLHHEMMMDLLDLK